MRRALALMAAIVLLASFATAPAAAGGPPIRAMSGNWIAVDCATWWQSFTHDVNCELFGDKSVMALTIGPGVTPAVRFVDTYSTYCVEDGFAPRFVGLGSGRYFTDPTFEGAGFLEVTLTDTRCGTDPAPDYTHSSDGAFTVAGPTVRGDSDELWDDWTCDGCDTDWGTVWYRP